MSCGNSKQQLERAGINAMHTCTVSYRNADKVLVQCNCIYSEHRDELLSTIEEVKRHNILKAQTI